MNCIIIEDQLPAQRIIKKYLEEFPSLTLIGSFQNAIEATDFLKRNEVGLIFLDINLPKISGINFLKNLNHPPQVIITSAYAQYALEGFELDVLDYLLKPFSLERFHKAIAKVESKSEEIRSDFIFIKSDKEFFKVKKSTIRFVKGDDDFTRVYTTEKMFLDSRTLKDWMKELPSTFIRVHKSYILNLEFITRIAGLRVFQGDQDFPIGRVYKSKLMELVETR